MTLLDQLRRTIIVEYPSIMRLPRSARLCARLFGPKTQFTLSKYFEAGGILSLQVTLVKYKGRDYLLEFKNKS